jgi:hypothetical protein
MPEGEGGGRECDKEEFILLIFAMIERQVMQGMDSFAI